MRCQKQRMTQKVRKLNSIGPSDSVMPKAKLTSSGDRTLTSVVEMAAALELKTISMARSFNHLDVPQS